MVLRGCIKVGKYVCMQTRVSSEMEKLFRRKFRSNIFSFSGSFAFFVWRQFHIFSRNRLMPSFRVFATFRESFYSLETLGKFLMKKLQRKVENLVLHVPGVERIISTGLLELNSQTYQQLISSMFK